MGLFKRKTESRAETVSFEDALLQALLNPDAMTKAMALQIPEVSGAIDLIGNVIAATPIKLYKDADGKAAEQKTDPRVKLLNDETGDTLNAHDFWKAIVSDYFLGKGGYAYIRKDKGKVSGLHYVDESKISVLMNVDPIFKDFDINVMGTPYKPFDFLKVLRNTKDGAQGVGIVSANSKLLTVAYQTMIFENALVQKGGNKKGFLTSETKLDDAAMDKLREAWKRLYGNNEENVIVLNKGLAFQESSNTALEMQLNENKQTNAAEFSKIFHIPPEVLEGKATEADISALARIAAIPLMVTIQCALNKDLLLESEKGSLYFAFDTKELLKGDILNRYKAYEIGLKNGFKTRSEIRYAEDDPTINGLDFVSMSLADVIFDPKTGTFFTPNTRQVTDGKTAGNPPLEGGETV